VNVVNEITTNNAPAAIGPYAQAVETENFVFTSGQIPLRPDGSLVKGGIAEQVNQVLVNLDAVLAAAGVKRSDVVKATIFMTDLGDFGVVNEVFTRFFGQHRPARSTVQIAALPKGANVEIEMIASKG
jgi:2-iminobutanoate/2-iminopropanoate deaminase